MQVILQMNNGLFTLRETRNRIHEYLKYIITHSGSCQHYKLQRPDLGPEPYQVDQINGKTMRVYAR